ncbi:unnamed protein product [Clonostachys rosea]|uniref:Uncharacterized protein n=1 Tax=Bionectria ochroleuca TaxID=29856 RepID=A0ABY6UIM6_BIOOC|nr:unnamed protein product [Clonostachys rosea]
MAVRTEAPVYCKMMFWRFTSPVPSKSTAVNQTLFDSGYQPFTQGTNPWIYFQTYYNAVGDAGSALAPRIVDARYGIRVLINSLDHRGFIYIIFINIIFVDINLIDVNIVNFYYNNYFTSNYTNTNLVCFVHYASFNRFLDYVKLLRFLKCANLVRSVNIINRAKLSNLELINYFKQFIPNHSNLHPRFNHTANCNSLTEQLKHGIHADSHPFADISNTNAD